MKQLTGSEQAMLDLLEEHRGELVTRQELNDVLPVKAGQQERELAFSNIVDVHMKNLRRKITEEIETVRGKGYRLV